MKLALKPCLIGAKPDFQKILSSVSSNFKYRLISSECEHQLLIFSFPQRKLSSLKRQSSKTRFLYEIMNMTLSKLISSSYELKLPVQNKEN